MEIILKETASEASIIGARAVAAQIRRKPDSVLGLATGRTPQKLYAELIRMHREEGLDFSKVTTFNLDEYIGLPPKHDQSYRYFMQQELFDHINIPLERTNMPNGMVADLQGECLEYEERIKAAGGIDLQVLGLGSNGHIGFNEPTGSLNSRTWIKILSENTIRDNSAMFERIEDVPHYCITMGIGTIMDARHCLVLAFGAKKARAVHAMVEGPMTALWPCTRLQMHPRTTVLTDTASSARLDHPEHYLWIEKNKLAWQKY